MMDDLEQDVARLKEKWFGAGTTPPRALDLEEEAIAAKWLGKTEAQKLASTRGGKKYRPPVVLAHWGYIPSSRESRYDPATGGFVQGDYWYCETFRGTEKETLFAGDKIGCLKAVDRLQKMGISVTRVGQERAPEEIHGHPKIKPGRSKRFAIMNQLKEFGA